MCFIGLVRLLEDNLEILYVSLGVSKPKISTIHKDRFNQEFNHQELYRLDYTETNTMRSAVTMGTIRAAADKLNNTLFISYSRITS